MVYKQEFKTKYLTKWFLPALQQIEALESSKLEGTQATLDGVLMYQALPTDEDVNINEVVNYSNATRKGLYILNRERFSNEFFQEIHSVLMEGNVRKPKQIGSYRTEQNYIGKNDKTHEITFVPPEYKKVEEKILITDGKQRNRKYIYYGLLEIIR